MSDARALPSPSRQSDPDRRRLAVSGQRRLQPRRSRDRRRDDPARPRRGPAGASRTSRSPARRTASTAGRSTPSHCSRPTPEVASEQWGFEDPRVVWVAELDRWVITCTAYGPAGPAVYLATTEDFTTVERYGIIRQPEDKNAALLPHRIDGRWILLHRPKTEFGGARGEIVLSRSPDLVSWSAPEQVLQPRAGAWWDSLRIGIGPPPLRTEHGWLLVYHGVKETVSGELYRVGLALLDLDEPTRVLRRLPDLGPRAARPLRADRRRPERRLSLRARPRRRQRRGAPLLRRRRQHDLPRDRAARRPPRGRARGSRRRVNGVGMSKPS